MGCAECHDHKFDPILTRDFYSMKAFFANIKETGLVPDRGINAWGSKLILPSAEQQRRSDELNRQVAWLNAELENRAGQLLARDTEWEERLRQLHEAGLLSWRFQRPVAAKAAHGAKLTVFNDETLTVTVYRGGNLITEQIKGDGMVIASGANPENETYTVTFKPGVGEWTALGIEVVQDESLPANRLARGADRFVLTEVEAELGQGDGETGGQRDRGAGRQRDKVARRAGNSPSDSPSIRPSGPPSLRSPVSPSPPPLVAPSPRLPLPFALATTDGVGQHPENHAMNAIDGDPKTAWGVSFADGRGSFIALRLAQKLQTSADSIITLRLRHDSEFRRASIGRFRVALSSAQYSWPDHTAKTPNPMNGLPEDVLKALKEPEEKRREAQKKALFEFFKWSSPELQPLIVKLAKLEAEFDLLDSQIPRVVVTETMIPMETRVQPRGNFLDDSGEVVQPAVPAVFGKLDTPNRRANRLDLANWIASPDNPLTARVFVNRMWRQFFGIGLSKALDDFGSQGEWPTHPELLDWLAAEFMHPSDCGLWIADCGLNGPHHDWDVKHIIRVIVTSHTYRQSSNPESNPPSAIHHPPSDDPDNRLLARQSRFRADAEIVRDIALSVSGLLAEKFGGPPAKPYQP